jgi:hypothetical protein
VKWVPRLVIAIAATVIGGWILDATDIFDLGGALVRFAKAIRGVASTAVSLPLWGLLLVALVSFLIPLTVLAIRRRLAAGPWWLTYTRDRILDVDWQWQYWGPKAPIPKEPTPLCPVCGFEMTFFQASGYAAVGYVGLACENCNHRVRFELRERDLLEQVRKHIEHRVRTKAAV